LAGCASSSSSSSSDEDSSSASESYSGAAALRISAEAALDAGLLDLLRALAAGAAAAVVEGGWVDGWMEEEK
jgi:hypothetical protein